MDDLTSEPIFQPPLDTDNDGLPNTFEAGRDGDIEPYYLRRDGYSFLEKTIRQTQKLTFLDEYLASLTFTPMSSSAIATMTSTVSSETSDSTSFSVSTTMSTKPSSKLPLSITHNDQSTSLSGARSPTANRMSPEPATPPYSSSTASVAVSVATVSNATTLLFSSTPVLRLSVQFLLHFFGFF